jgi:hypothetical protein
MDFLTCAVVIGAGATAVMDLWTLVRARLLGERMPDYAWLGRRLAALLAWPHERAIGWTAHYLIGIAFAGALLAIWGVEWARQPTLAPALVVGIVTLAAPILIGTARWQSLVTHTIFGFGLYAAARLAG